MKALENVATKKGVNAIEVFTIEWNEFLAGTHQTQPGLIMLCFSNTETELEVDLLFNTTNSIKAKGGFSFAPVFSLPFPQNKLPVQFWSLMSVVLEESSCIHDIETVMDVFMDIKETKRDRKKTMNIESFNSA